jgi:hypothetical protein
MHVGTHRRDRTRLTPILKGLKSRDSLGIMAEIAKRNEGTIAVITGGARGVGYAIARKLVAEGCRSYSISLKKNWGEI